MNDRTISDARNAAEATVPASPEAEAGVLGCCLLAPDSVDAGKERKVSAHWFHDLRNALVWKAISDLHAKGVPPDAVTLAEQLKANGVLDQVGGLARIGELMSAAPSAVNLPWYLDLLAEKHTLRKCLEVCREVESEVFESDETPERIVSKAEGRFVALAEGAIETPGISIKEGLRQVVDDLEEYHRGGLQVSGKVLTGLSFLDKKLSGIGGRNGNFIVIAGRPGTGKTALASQVAFHAAIEHKLGAVPVLVFSMEMAAAPFLKRAMFARAGVDQQRFREGFSAGPDLPALVKANEEMSRSKVWIDDESNLDIDSLRARARRYYRRENIGLIVIDYIQLMRPSRRTKDQNRAYELEDISHGLQALGKELNVPIICLAQMNRNVEQRERGNKTPQLADLKDSGAIEQDADVVIFLHKPHLKDDEEERFENAREVWMAKERRRLGLPDHAAINAPYVTEAFVAKNRYGPSSTGSLLCFHGGSTRYEDYFEWLKELKLKDYAAGEKASRDDAGEPGEEIL